MGGRDTQNIEKSGPARGSLLSSGNQTTQILAKDPAK